MMVNFCSLIVESISAWWKYSEYYTVIEKVGRNWGYFSSTPCTISGERNVQYEGVLVNE